VRILIVAMSFLLSMARAGEVTLTAPATIPAGAPFEVRWTGAEEEKGAVITLANADGTRLAGASYAYISPKGVVNLEAPPQPGSYAILYKMGNDVLGTRRLTVTPVSATLSIVAIAGMREKLTIQWSGPEYGGAIVQVYAVGGAKVPGAYAYVANAKGRPIELVAPEQPGDYELRYLLKDQVLAVARFSVRAVDAALTAAKTAMAGAELTVTWSGPDNQGDRLMLARPGADKTLPGASYAYLATSVDHSLNLTLPEQPGDYEVVYLTGSAIIARAPVTVMPVSASLEAPAKVTGNLAFETAWQGPANRGDLIVMVDPAADKQALAYSYIDPLQSRVSLTAPAQPGSYELRYRTGKGRDLATRPIQVTPPPAEPGSLQVTQPKQGLGAGSAVEVILDASGSMLQRQDGKRRIDIAKATLTELVRDTIPAGTGFAMRVFGHKEAGSCRSDLEMPLAPLKAAAATARIATIQAQNLAKTPIAASLAMVASDLAEVRDERVVVLVTDGEETCDGDPVLSIKTLRAKGWDIRINIVGYAIEDASLRQTFESWAALGGGRYLDAAGGDELAAAFRAAVAVPFEVVGADGVVVARGLAGSDPIALPAGTYQVRYRSGGATREQPVTIQAKESTQVALK